MKTRSGMCTSCGGPAEDRGAIDGVVHVDEIGHRDERQDLDHQAVLAGDPSADDRLGDATSREVVLFVDDKEHLENDEVQYGCAILPIAGLPRTSEEAFMDALHEVEPIERVYGPSEFAARHNAALAAAQAGCTVVDIAQLPFDDA